MTCHPSVESEFSSLTSESTITNQHIITSKGAGTAIPFSLAIIEQLLDKDITQSIADTICFKSYLEYESTEKLTLNIRDIALRDLSAASEKLTSLHYLFYL